MSEHNWMPTEMTGVIGLKVEEYERLKADSKRLDKVLDDCIVAYKIIRRGSHLIEVLEYIETREDIDKLEEQK